MSIINNFKYKILPCGRFYVINDEYYGSVTTILHGFKSKTSTWMHDNAKVGTACHNYLSRKFNKYIPPEELLIWNTSQNDVYSKLNKFKTMINKLDISPIDLEIPVYYNNNGVKYAGKLDLIYKDNIDGKICLGDIKTGMMYDYYPLQLAAYYQAIRDIFNIEKCAILHCDLSNDRNPNNNIYQIEIDLKDIHRNVKEFNELCIKYNISFNKWLIENKFLEEVNVK